MGPASAILVDRLHAARQYFRAIRFGQAKSSGGRLVHISRRCSLRMGRQVSEYRFHESIEGWYRHLNNHTNAGAKRCQLLKILWAESRVLGHSLMRL